MLGAVAMSACDGSNPVEAIKKPGSDQGKDDIAAAIIQLKSAVQHDPASAESRFLLGQALLAAGDPASAAVELRKALELKQPPAQVVTLLGQALLASGQERKLVDEFGEFKLAEPVASADLQTSLAAAYALLGNSQKAQSAIEIALATVPNYPQALLLQARHAAEAGKFDAALGFIDKVIAATPTNAQAFYQRGDVLFRGKADSVGAMDAFNKALSLKPSHVAARSNVIVLLMAKPDLKAAQEQLELLRKTLPNHPQTGFFDAQLAFLNKKPKRALELIEPVLKVAPDNPQVLQLAGSLQLGSGALLQAERSLTKALTLAPNSPFTRQLLAQTYLRLGQPAKSLATLQPLLEAPAPNAKTYALAGQAQLLAGNSNLSASNLANAVKLDPTDTLTRTYLAIARWKAVGNEATVVELQRIADSDKGTVADLALVSFLISNRDFSRALTVVDGIEKKLPKDTIGLNLRGQVQTLQKDNAGARTYFERALAIDPINVQAASNLAALDLADKKPEAARKRIEAILVKAPKSYSALMALAKLLQISGAPPEETTRALVDAMAANPTDPEPRLLLIELQLKTRKVKAALTTAVDASATLPSNVLLLDALGRAQMAGGDHNQAILTFKKIAALEPAWTQPHMRLAGAYLATRNNVAAEQSLRRALNITPDFLEAQKALVDLMLTEKRRDDAVLVAKTVQKQRPNGAVGWLLEGAIEERQRNMPAAVEIYRKALKKFPEPELSVKLHSTLIAAKDNAGAAAATSAWLAAHPKDTVLLAYLGDAAMLRRDFVVAEEVFRKVAAIQPANSAALNNIAWIMVKLGKPGAVGFAEQAVKLQPQTAGLLDTLAMALAAENQLDKAIETQRKAVALEPTDAVLRLNIAKLYIQSGEKVAARTELQELAKLGTKFQAHTEVNRLLQSL